MPPLLNAWINFTKTPLTSDSTHVLTFLTLDKADEVEEGAKVDLVRFDDNEDIAEFILKFLSEEDDEDDVILEKLRRRKNNNKVFFFLPKFHY